MDRARKGYVKKELVDHQNDYRKFWRLINLILPGQKGAKPKVILKSNETGSLLGEDETADYINDYFTGIGPKLAENMFTPWKFYDERVANKIDKFETNLQEVKKLVHEINITKSSAIDGISSKILKTAFTHTPDRLVDIFNCSFNTQVIPDVWKISKVTPIPKAGDPRLVNNYRPISLIPLPCKLIEKIVHNRLYGFFTREHVITENQGGFRAGHSTIDTLACFTDDILRNLNVGINTIAAFIDLRKAFDTVDHIVLLAKLEHYGTRDHNFRWLQNYLGNRKQCVRVNGVQSGLRDVVCGVPQGSILGALLFLMYVNDVCKCIKTSKLRLYADDTVIYNCDPDFHTVARRSADTYAI